MENISEISQYIAQNKKYFNEQDLESVKTILEKSNKNISEINTIKLKSPAVGAALSVFLGWLGIDRFYAGSYVYGIVKLFTCGLCFVGWIIDWFLIGKSIKNENYFNLYCGLGYGSKQEIKKSYNKAIGKNTVDFLKSDEGKDAIKGVVSSFKDLRDSMDINNH
ncbi:MAG: TM2 domain-containing protein [Hominilimicola sp.]